MVFGGKVDQDSTLYTIQSSHCFCLALTISIYKVAGNGTCVPYNRGEKKKLNFSFSLLLPLLLAHRGKDHLYAACVKSRSFNSYFQILSILEAYINL